MQVWAEPFTKLRMQKIYNLYQDPFERADVTSNTYWDWNLNEIGGVYGTMDDVLQLLATFREFPPRSFPPSFVPSNIMESTLDAIKQRKALTEGLDVERIRAKLNAMIEQQIQQRRGRISPVRS
jgi:arylsulfatase